jgi:hypothetical protein
LEDARSDEARARSRLTFFFVSGVALSAVERRGARLAGRSVPDASVVGAASGAGSSSSRRTCSLVTFCGFGAG